MLLLYCNFLGGFWKKWLDEVSGVKLTVVVHWVLIGSVKLTKLQHIPTTTTMHILGGFKLC